MRISGRELSQAAGEGFLSGASHTSVGGTQWGRQRIPGLHMEGTAEDTVPEAPSMWGSFSCGCPPPYREQAQDGVCPVAPPAWLPYVPLWGSSGEYGHCFSLLKLLVGGTWFWGGQAEADSFWKL